MIEKTFVRQPRSPQSPVALDKAARYALWVTQSVVISLTLSRRHAVSKSYFGMTLGVPYDGLVKR